MLVVNFNLGDAAAEFAVNCPRNRLVELKAQRAGLRGEASTLMMLPSFLPAASAPRTGESVLVLDAGGTNLRAGRVRFDEAGKPVTEALQKRRMPGTLGKDTSAEEMFRAALSRTGKSRQDGGGQTFGHQ